MSSKCLHFGATPHQADMDVAVIGAGFSGLCAAIQLKKAGYTSVTLFDALDDLGGTWWQNTYPGCACDIPSPLYSFSFEPNPYWTRMFSPQPEIWRYMKHCADRYGLYPQIRFSTPIVKAAYDEAAGHWRLTTDAGETVTARVLVSGIGPLNIPAYPDIPGRESFAGPQFHSARWDHGLDLTGKRVAVIGTGASAIQFVPQIAPQVSELHLYQRTPGWIAPRPDRAFTRFEHWLYATLPVTQWLLRNWIYWTYEFRALGFTRYPALLKFLSSVPRNHLKKQIRDPELRAKLTPTYTMGCKRVLLSNDFYPSLTRDNVELVTEGIASIGPRSITARDGTERPADVLIHGTGFQATEPIQPGTILGRPGRDLGAEWQGGPKGYLGVAANGYPNLFFLIGPNSGLGHNSMIYIIESQVRFLVESVRTMEMRRAKSMEVTQEAQDAFNRDLQERMKKTVWATGCQSWYLTKDGFNGTLWPDFTFTYRARTKRPNMRHFRIETS